jgi:nitroimidazol reductase NimA-like FMN-containing flavoprotein (pyridoxamine 5'-phosphate oxidase superfamily)
MSMANDRVIAAIPVEECRRLLRSGAVGRVAVNRRGHGPLVVPVNYVVDGTGAIVFRTDIGSKLSAIRRGAVSFEIDDVDPSTRTGWSVLVEGLAHEIDVTEDAATQVEPWAGARLRHAVRIVPSTISGRRLA